MSKQEMSQAELDALIEKARKEGIEEKEAEIKAAKDRQDELDNYALEQVAKALAEKEEEIEAAKKEAEEAEKKAKEDATKGRRLRDLPEGVTQAKFTELYKYDNLSADDTAFMLGVQKSWQHLPEAEAPKEAAVKALAVKLGEDKGEVGRIGRQAMKMAGVPIKGDEVMQQDLTGYGDEWVGAAYSQSLWNSIRADTFVAANMPSVEVPQGYESITLPLEGADPTYYKVAEVTDTDATSLIPVATIPTSQMATSSKTLSLVKMGARVIWSGELQEDSLIPFVAQLRSQMAAAGADNLEHAIIAGDTALTAATNINDIAGTAVAADIFTLFNGMRKSALVTTAANSRNGGTITDADYIETMKLMGTAGLNSSDVTKCAFIQDGNVRWKSLQISEVKTRDVYSNPTIENGMLVNIWGYPVFTSYNMHKGSAVRKANTDGKVDLDTTTNNTTGSILGVRWDQWLLGYRRRMTMETTRYARSDSTELVAMMRLGLVQRDTEACAISYGLAV